MFTSGSRLIVWTYAWDNIVLHAYRRMGMGSQINKNENKYFGVDLAKCSGDFF